VVSLPLVAVSLSVLDVESASEAFSGIPSTLSFNVGDGTCKQSTDEHAMSRI